VFRGQDRAEFELQTSLARFLGGREDELEAHLLRAFRKYAYGASEARDDWTWLALAQHHGLPTRLLDWTYSPHVALHFATADPGAFDADGAVWRVDFERTNALLPDALRDVLTREGTPVFTVDMLAGVADGLAAFDALDGGEFVSFLEPPSMDARVVNQSALFSLASSPRLDLRAWLGARPATARRIVVSAALKWEVRDRLDQAGVSERVLFPGLDGLSRWLTRYYQER
jgi:hypothetical protein